MLTNIQKSLINQIVSEEITFFVNKMSEKTFNRNNFIMNQINQNFVFYSSLSRSFDSSLGNTFQTIAGRIAKLIYGENNVQLPKTGADLVIFYNNRYYIIEIKLGGNLDSKKLPSEFNALEAFYYKSNLNNTVNLNSVSFCLGTVYIEESVARKLHSYFNISYTNPQYYLLLENDFWNFICGKNEDGFSTIKAAYENNIYLINNFLNNIQ